MKRGKLVSCEGINMPDNKVIRAMKGDDDGCKYLGVLEVDDIKHTEMKRKVQKEYFRRVRKILKSRLNGGNIIKAKNARAVSVMRIGYFEATRGYVIYMNKHISPRGLKITCLYSTWTRLTGGTMTNRCFCYRGEY